MPNHALHLPAAASKFAHAGTRHDLLFRLPPSSPLTPPLLHVQDIFSFSSHSKWGSDKMASRSGGKLFCLDDRHSRLPSPSQWARTLVNPAQSAAAKGLLCEVSCLHPRDYASFGKDAKILSLRISRLDRTRFRAEHVPLSPSVYGTVGWYLYNSGTLNYCQKTSGASNWKPWTIVDQFGHSSLLLSEPSPLLARSSSM